MVHIDFILVILPTSQPAAYIENVFPAPLQFNPIRPYDCLAGQLEKKFTNTHTHDKWMAA